MFKTILSIVDRHRLRCDRFHRDCPSSIRHAITSTAVGRKYRRCSPEHQVFDRYLRRFKSRVLSAANMRSDYRCRRAHRLRIRTFDPRAYTPPTPDGNAAEECDLVLLNHTINHVPHSEALKLILNPRARCQKIHSSKAPINERESPPFPSYRKTPGSRSSGASGSHQSPAHSAASSRFRGLLPIVLP